ncbi:hypothetical protein JTB14_011008 [Gonioctena quinquepunctata]|nr:hypothetical protein JTB14_011008 [Gonioctena quinquepunctata]
MGLIISLLHKIYQLLGSTDDSEEKDSNQSQTSKEKNKHRGNKTRQKSKKQYEDPSFSTTLLTPIEDIIEETITEEITTDISQASGSKKKNKTNNKLTKSERVQLAKNVNKIESDEFGYSFFKNKLIESPKPEKPQKTPSKIVLNEEVPPDDLGFSFLPVREKGKRYKHKNTSEKKDGKETLNELVQQTIKTTKDDPSKPGIIEHYQKKRGKQAVIETVPVVTFEKIHIFAYDYKLEEKLQPEYIGEYKESKKVSATISYASVLTNNVSEILESKRDESSQGNGSEKSGSDQFNSKDNQEEFKSQNTFELSNKSNSSSIEVLSDISLATQGNLARGTEEIPSNFEVIQKNINKLVSSDSSFERASLDVEVDDLQHCCSENSSICVIDDLADCEKSVEFSIDQLPEEEQQFPEIDLHFGDQSKKTLPSEHHKNTDESNFEDNPNELKETNSLEKRETDKTNSLADVFPIIEHTLSFQRKGSLVSSTADSSIPDSLKEFIELERKFTEFDRIASISEDVFVIERKESVSEISFNFPQSHSSLSEESYTDKNSEKFVFVENSCSQAPIQYWSSRETSSDLFDDIPQNIADQRKQKEVISSHAQTESSENFDHSEILLENKQEISPQFVGDSTKIQTNALPESVNGISLEIKGETYVNNGLFAEQNLPSKLSTSTSNLEISKGNTEVSNKQINSPEHLDEIQRQIEKEIILAGLENTAELSDSFQVTSKNSKNSSSKLIEEEKCIKKYSYITGITEEPIESQPLMATIEEDKKLSLETMQQIRVLTLNNLEHQESTLYRIKNDWIIQFRVGPSLFGRKVFLYCNYPVEKSGKLADFNRNKYQLLEWVWDEGCENADDTAAFTQIKAGLAGSFHYFFTYEKGENFEKNGSGYFLVDPVLKYGKNEDLPLDCIQCQTVLTKSLGSLSTWEKKLQVAKESGYNMLHFTPIQELGESNSSYSLREQLELNPVFQKDNGEMPTFDEVEKIISKLREEWKMTSICDIVLNHTANESKWIQDHPEVTYNCLNCPYMRPAYLLDAALHQFSLDVKKGLYEDRGITSEVNTEEHLNAIRYHFRKSVLEPLKIEELYMCDVNKYVLEFLALTRTIPPVNQLKREEPEQLKLEHDLEYRRLSATVDMDLVMKLYNVYWNDTFDEESRQKRCAEEFKKKLEMLNEAVVKEINEYLDTAVDNVIAGLRYYRVQPDGPRFKDINISTPLVYRYFTDFGMPKSLKEHEEIMYSDKGRFLMAHNGWVMNSDPLKNFAASDSKVYIKRELIAWGDSVKLRFGNKPEDCPFLWDHMRKYVEQTARIFDGVRLDNCHSTPIPVAEYLLDCARRIKPNLYVVAELFTNSDMTDNIFVNRLGITSLIREAMSAWDSHEEGRLVYRYGGCPVGSFYQPSIRPLVPSIAHALFLDQTHDNPSPIEKRSVFDLLPSTALVNMACCASGSNRGYDELVPHHIHVVDETREYTEWTEDENLAMGNLRFVTKTSGLIGVKKAINDLHFTLGKEGFKQVYVDQMDPDIVAVTRHCPETHQSLILVAFTAFSHPDTEVENNQRAIKPLRFEGVLKEIVLEASLSHIHKKSAGLQFCKWKNFAKDAKYINGLSEYQVSMKQHISVADSDIFENVDSGAVNVTQLNFRNFKPGSIAVIRVSLPETMKNAVKTVRNLIDKFSMKKQSNLFAIIGKMSLADLNRALYRCDQEERDEGFGFDTYNIPNFGPMVYAGLQGCMSLLANIRPNNDLGHPMCANLRDGNWMIDYVWKRLNLDPGTEQLGYWIQENTESFKDMPRYLVPCYFDMLITGIYVLLVEQCFSLMTNFVRNGSTFARGLSMGSVQFGAHIKSANLPTLSPSLAPPKPPTRKNDNDEVVQACVTLSAGLPHFSVGYMRNWGRDTFIALRGLFLLTGRFQEAREHILGYGACLRHGLIPNLLDGGRNSRFNCRDAVWWWLYCIKEYVSDVPDGISILSDKVSRVFPKDDSLAQSPGVVDQPLHDVIQEALKVHFQGLAFRERNAGHQIDEHMTDQGFNNQIGVHPETGFVFGGNQWNCGTWMDKMGSSDKAGNRGKPATPRDGSAIELVGLSKSVITWLAKLGTEGKYPYIDVERTHKDGKITRWTFKEWSDKIQSSFEKYFWVNSKPTEGEIRPDLINKRGIYRDCFGASQEWTDFQLRCNFPIAMVAAPELFSPTYAWEALAQAEKHLLGPLGMKTLDPEDWAYRGDYDNSNDSNDPTVANGFNYHQGPEWVWPVGFFLRAKLIFAAQNGALNETLASTKLILSKHFVELQTSAWKGLPELTNSSGSYCRDSSRTQAWSMSCVLEVLYDLQKLESSINLLGN